MKHMVKTLLLAKGKRHAASLLFTKTMHTSRKKEKKAVGDK
jgi:hypothetical protein